MHGCQFYRLTHVHSSSTPCQTSWRIAASGCHLYRQVRQFVSSEPQQSALHLRLLLPSTHRVIHTFKTMSTITDSQPIRRRKKGREPHYLTYKALQLTLPIACDLCFTKKIKCDQLEPRCSNCVLYKTQCCHTIIRHRVNPPKPRSEPRIVQKQTAVNSLGHQGRSAAYTDNIADEQGGPNPEISDIPTLAASPNHGQAQSQALNISGPPRVGSTSSTASGTLRHGEGGWTFDPLKPSLYYGPPDSDLSLPSLDVRPVISNRPV